MRSFVKDATTHILQLIACSWTLPVTKYISFLTAELQELVFAATNTSSKENMRSPAFSLLFEMAFAADGKSHPSSELAVPEVES